MSYEYRYEDGQLVMRRRPPSRRVKIAAKPIGSSPPPRDWLPSAEVLGLTATIAFFSTIFWWCALHMPDYAPGAVEMKHLFDKIVW